MSGVNITNEDSVHTSFFSSVPNSDIVYWEAMCNQINSTLKALSAGYIWHRDDFKACWPIQNKDNSEDSEPLHLIATTCFGDNIEDEWFIIYLLLELSKKYEELIIQVIDNDGDFMLIEAADYLPSWANPENTENRVFIYHDAIHLIPPHLADLKNKLCLTDALQLVENYSQQTVVPSEIKNSILNRIGQYPAKISESIHRGIVYLPLDIAAILTLQPSLIAPIVTTYCNHDTIDLKACRKIHLNDHVYVKIQFTKCLYAMLINSKLISNNAYTTKEKIKDLGLRITYGFQMLMNSLTKDIFSTKDFNRFKNNLTMNGYFRNNIEGSQQYNKLLESAKKYFVDMECPISTYVSNKVSKIMITDDFLKCKESLKAQNINNKDITEDSDEWLNIQPNQLNDLLNKRFGNNVKFHNEDLATPETVTSKLADFLKQSSDFEGVDTKSNNDSDNDGINFDVDVFVDCLEKYMKLASGDMNSSSDLDSQCEGDIYDDDVLDEELATKLNSYEEHKSDRRKVMFNLTKSIKEEGLSGPTSNLLSSIGINKTDLIDSDSD